MKFVCYSDWDQLPGSANALFELGEKDSIFYSRPWFENLSTALDADESMVLACVVTGNKVVAVLPLIKSSVDDFHALQHRYTTHYSLLLADEDQQQVLTCLVQGLDQLPLRSLLLEPVADNDSRIFGLQQIMEAAGYLHDLGKITHFLNSLRTRSAKYAHRGRH